MNDNYFMLDGKKLPMDEGTIQSLRKMHENRHVPVVRVASFGKSLPYDRVIIRLSKPAKELFDGLYTSDIVVINEYGYLTNNWLASDELVNGMPDDTYSNIQTLIEGNLP